MERKEPTLTLRNEMDNYNRLMILGLFLLYKF